MLRFPRTIHKLTDFQVHVRHRGQILTHAPRVIRVENPLMQRMRGHVHPRHLNAGDFRCQTGDGSRRCSFATFRRGGSATVTAGVASFQQRFRQTRRDDFLAAVFLADKGVGLGLLRDVHEEDEERLTFGDDGRERLDGEFGKWRPGSGGGDDGPQGEGGRDDRSR